MAEESVPDPDKRGQLADALDRASRVAGGGHVLRSGDLARTDREKLERAGWLMRLMKGWYLLVPGGAVGDSTPYYACYWEFVRRYLENRFGSDYCLSAEASLRRHLDPNTVPRQLSVQAGRGGTDTLNWPFGTSAITWQPRSLPDRVETIGGINVYPLTDAIVHVPASAWRTDPMEMEIALRAVRSPESLAQAVVVANSTASAERIIGAFEFMDDHDAAQRILDEVAAAGLRPQPRNPFDHETPKLGSGRVRPASPYEARVTALWAEMRDAVIATFPEAPGLEDADRETWLRRMEDIYVHDAYHSLSIEGYRITPALVERIREGRWDPEHDAGDASERDALAARGYAGAFDLVEHAVGEIVDGADAGDLAANRYREWFRALFQPSVDAGIISAADLVGFRRGPVYIRGAWHVPPPAEAVTDAMEAWEGCLGAETNSAVRAILGHFLLTYIHPYMDGNGRLARFLLNTQLASGGYPWTVIRSEPNSRTRYMKALDRASTERDIVPFTECVRDAMQDPPT